MHTTIAAPPIRSTRRVDVATMMRPDDKLPTRPKNALAVSSTPKAAVLTPTPSRS
jgi:hypothetical protein